jgi:hypothetical protein
MATVRDDQEQFIRCRDIERLTLEQWHHVTVTCDGRELLLYRHGKAVSSVACIPVSSSPALRVWIGVGGEGPGLWEGRIDELALFNKSLSPEQIRALYEVAPQR